MNKLTITDKVFVPVTLAEGLPNYLDEIYTITQGLINKGLVKEETNKYVLSKEELEKVVSDAIKFGISKQSSFEICGGKNVKLIDLTNEFLNSKL